MSNRTLTRGRGTVGFVLVHGLGGTPAELRYISNSLERAGHAVDCCILPGHCGSEADLIASRWPQWSEQVAQAYREMRKRCDCVIVGGLSMGAILALKLAASETEQPDGVVLFAPALNYDGWAVPWYSFLIRLLKDTPIRHVAHATEREPYGLKDERIRKIVLGQLLSGDSSAAGSLRTPGEALRQFVLLVDDVKPLLGRVSCPALIFHPREDDMASMTNSTYLMRRLSGLAECVILDDCYHMITIDRQRELVADKTLRWTEWLVDRQSKTPVQRKTATLLSSGVSQAPAVRSSALKPTSAA